MSPASSPSNDEAPRGSTSNDGLRQRFKDGMGRSASTTSLSSKSSSEDDPKTAMAKGTMRIAYQRAEESSSSSTVMCSSLFIMLIALLIRSLVALHSYSGQATPPVFGDFEAQRHWMEITLHTPLLDWYRQTTTNNLGYWGLDYPPLSAYWAYITGYMYRVVARLALGFIV